MEPLGSPPLYANQLAIECNEQSKLELLFQKSTLWEVHLKIAFNAMGIILNAFPQLAKIPLDILSDRIWKGFIFKSSSL